MKLPLLAAENTFLSRHPNSTAHYQETLQSSEKVWHSCFSYGKSERECPELVQRGWGVGGALENRSEESLAGAYGVKRMFTQHPLYSLRTHSSASLCAVEVLAGVIIPARIFLFWMAFSYPDDAAICHHIEAWTKCFGTPSPL